MRLEKQSLWRFPAKDRKARREDQPLDGHELSTGCTQSGRGSGVQLYHGAKGGGLSRVVDMAPLGILQTVQTIEAQLCNLANDNETP